MTALPGVHLGARQGPFDSVLERDLVRRFAAATRDPSRLAADGRSVPPVVLMTQVWEAQLVGRDSIIHQDVRSAGKGGGHAEHDVVVHRPLRPDERLRSWVEGYGSRPGGANSFSTLLYSSYDEAGELVVEQWWTNFYLGVTCAEAGPPLPDHRFPEEARRRQVAEYDIFLDADLPRRYAEVTDDWSPLHFDLEAARCNGFPGLSAHGLCTLALCSQGLVAEVAGGDPNRVRRLAARFAAPALLGEDLRVRIYQAGTGVFAFEAECGGRPVVRHGRAELRP